MIFYRKVEEFLAEHLGVAVPDLTFSNLASDFRFVKKIAAGIDG